MSPGRPGRSALQASGAVGLLAHSYTAPSRCSGDLARLQCSKGAQDAAAVLHRRMGLGQQVGIAGAIGAPQCAHRTAHTRLDRHQQGCTRGRRKPGTDRAPGLACGPTPRFTVLPGGQQPC